jgi:hypothetical protein
MRIRDKRTRVDEGFEELLKRISLERIKTGHDKKLRSTRRITKAMRRHPLILNISKDIINADLDCEDLK